LECYLFVCYKLKYIAMGRKIGSIEAFALQNLKQGQFFYTHKQDKDMTAIAGYYKVKITTERMVAIDTTRHERIEFITKVTIL